MTLLSISSSPNRARILLYMVLIKSFLTLVWPSNAIIFDEVSSLHVWLTISSLANKDPSNSKALLFRQIELNWINAPLDTEQDYIGLYLDGEPDENSLPVSIHRLNGQMNGQIITDFYLPRIDFYAEAATLATGGEELRRQRHLVANGSRIRWPAESRSITSARADPMGSDTPTINGLPNDECLGYCLAYHSGKKILARNCLRTYANWMRASFGHIGARPLPTLMIPGSHNSATYPAQLDRSVLQMINKYQMNQDESIFNQLVYGIRHLDLRIGYNKQKQRPNERFWIYHDIFRTEISAREVFDQVRRFLELTTHEVIIMDFHRFTVGFHDENQATQRERHAKFIELLFRQLGDHIVPAYLGVHAPLAEYVAMGRRLIVGYAERARIVAQLGADSGSSRLQVASQNASPDTDATEGRADGTTATGGELDDDRRMSSRLYKKLKSLKLISKSFSKRGSSSQGTPVERGPVFKQVATATAAAAANSSGQVGLTQMPLLLNEDDAIAADRPDEMHQSLGRVNLLFPAVRHLWPNKDTLEGLAEYMNTSTCRKYFGELRSLMVELTPTVFGAISDKYDGNRRLAQLVNRPVTDWIRDRWLHCVNIVASDFFLGNDLIRLSIEANRMRAGGAGQSAGSISQPSQCRSFRLVEHLLDKSKIPLQFAYHNPSASDSLPEPSGNDIITHTSSNGNHIFLKPLTPVFTGQTMTNQRDRRDSFVDNVADGFSNLFHTFKRLLNL